MQETVLSIILNQFCYYEEALECVKENYEVDRLRVTG